MSLEQTILKGKKYPNKEDITNFNKEVQKFESYNLHFKIPKSKLELRFKKEVNN